MAVADQKVTDRYAIYCGDCLEVLPTLPPGKVHMSIYSPPFAGLYHYSSSPRDLSNCDDYGQFMEHFSLVVAEITRVTMPGRMTGVHCVDVPSGNSGNDHLRDFPGDIIRLHEKAGWRYVARYCVWKEPFAVRMRTLAKGLAHQTIVEDASRCSAANADYLLMFRKCGENKIPIEHPRGFLAYAGSREMPADVRRFVGHAGHQTENKYSHWIWRQYASAFWDDIRLDRVLPFRDCGDPQDEKHVHPLQLDVIERAITLWTNPDETVLTPFMGVGSEVFGAVTLERRGVGIELKPSYYRQAAKNLLVASSLAAMPEKQASLFAGEEARRGEATA